MKNKTGNILVVDDNKSVLSALKLLLQFEFNTIVTISNPNLIPEELKKHEIDIVLLDMNFKAGVNTGNEGLYWLKEIKKREPAVEVIVITAYGDVELAVKALKAGATDFILKPWENEKLLATLHNTLKLRQSGMEVKKLKEQERGLKREINTTQKMFIGDSRGMKNMMTLVEKVSGTDANVLITGENGTGKELVAREIHRRSNRADELLVTVDMGAIPENLFESELFGHKKGAFTDAKEDRIGKFKLAHGGTLFLDEIGNLPFPLQSKLLVAIESRMIIPVGSDRPVPIDIRLISATNAGLTELIQQKQFREDLFYRLNTIHIEIPPLRERGEDIELLASFFLNRYKKKYQKPRLRLGAPAVKKLMKYHWPGNVREIQHAIEKAVILAEKDILEPADFVFSTREQNIKEPCRSLEEMEEMMIEQTMNHHQGNITSAAEQLGITRQSLYNKIKRYGL